MKKTNKSIYYFCLILTVLLLIQCSTERINGPNLKGYFNVSFLPDTIASIHGMPNITYAWFENVPIFDSAYMISFSHINNNYNDLDGGWQLSIYIPKLQYLQSGLYYLEEFDDKLGKEFEKSRIDFEKFYNTGGDTVSTYSFSSCHTINQTGYFELYSTTDSTMGIKFSNLKLTNKWDSINAICSCNLTINFK